jgi:hypothetical protein
MKRARASRTSAVELLDDAGELSARAAPLMAVLWLSAMPARFALAYFLVRLVQLGGRAHEHGTYVRTLALVALLLWLPSLWGRQVWVRACRRALEGDGQQGWRALRVPLGELAAAAVAALFVELIFWALAPSLVVPLALLPVAALAAAASPRAGPGLFGPLRELFASVGSPVTLFGLMLLSLLALLLAFFNLGLFFQLAAWAASPLLGVEAVAWQRILALHNPVYTALLLAGATLLVEPFWLAAITVHVERVRAASSGEDLRQRFAELRAREDPARGAA